MKIAAALLSLCLPLSAFAQSPASPPAPVDVSSADAAAGALLDFSTITVTAPRQRNGFPPRTLKAARAGGASVAAGGLGYIVYAAIFGAEGPIGWAAGLIFFGGMTAYLAHRGLHGHDDLSPDEARKSGPAPIR